MGKRYLVVVLVMLCSSTAVWAQLKGVVKDKKRGETIVGASVLVKGTKIGTATDLDGRFELNYTGPWPATLVVSFIGYANQEVNVSAPNNALSVNLEEDQTILSEVSVVESRLSEKQKESALTVEAMDALAIKETPSVSFYEGLGNLKGVDLTSASIGFKVINTRGFNSTSPVRSLQLIDGVDNQSPGLNFSLGNFLGASELDVLSVDVIAGASTAFYGPNAFNGVIAMQTKDPFLYKGLSASVKVGERNLNEYAIRWADVLKNKKGEEVFAYKLNFYFLGANDWVANNLDPTEQSETGIDNPGGYDAVNRYGDEIAFDDGGDIKTYPGLGTFYRRGIEESYLVDYDTRNLKLGTSLHYRFKPDLELIYAFSFGNGTTVYQGDNRYSLKDILFFQNRLELRKKDKWFIRAYSTNEDAGNSYDAYFTALKMQESYATDGAWGSTYRNFWSFTSSNQVKNHPDYPDESMPNDQFADSMAVMIRNNIDFFNGLHANNRSTVNLFYGEEGLTPGTATFDSLFNYVVSRPFTEGGSKFIDRSALYHLQGEYKFDPTSWGTFVAGGNGRLYRPDSEGTIFRDTAGERITNWEFGMYGGWEKKFLKDRLKMSTTLRVDKNQNFDFLVSPAVSAVYQVDDVNSLRLSFSSAIRNPTLADQYLYYNVGRAVLLGNLTGYDSLVTTDEIGYFLGLPVVPPQGNPNADTRGNYQWKYFSIDPVRPERVRTVEAGYRTTLWNKLYVDLNYYFSTYTDFIGYSIVAQIDDNPDDGPITRLKGAQVYRIASNARDVVTTQGFSAGLNYYFWDNYMLSGNYTWNVLNTATDDPIIPAFNTPENKFNVSFSARDLALLKGKKDFGFNITYKWIQGFLFEGSPQFTGSIDTYDLLDAQVTYRIPSWHLTTKLGASNLLNNQVFQVYGGPRVGRMSYLSLSFDLN